MVCDLLNSQANAVALDEPLDDTALLSFTKTPLSYMARFIEEQRRSVLTGVAVRTKTGATERGTSHFGDTTIDGRRPSIATLHYVQWPVTSRPFSLIIKHPVAFTALLGVLTTRFRCFALVRNPVAVLGSWSSIPLAAHDGYMPIAQLLCPGLAVRLAKRHDVFERKLCLLNWFYEQYSTWLPPRNVLKYEDVIESSGEVLKVITGSDSWARMPLRNCNRNRFYDSGYINDVGNRLVRSDGAWRSFYSSADILQLIRPEVDR